MFVSLTNSGAAFERQGATMNAFPRWHLKDFAVLLLFLAIPLALVRKPLRNTPWKTLGLLIRGGGTLLILG